MALQLPVDRAAMRALATYLAAGLPDVLVNDDWPNPSKTLFDVTHTAGTLSVLRVGDRQDEWIQPRAVNYAPIHAAVSAAITTPQATDLATAITLVNALVASYEAHRVDLTAHVSADTTDAVTAPVATDQPTAIARANDLRTQYEAHRVSSAHANADTVQAVTAPAATDLPSLETLANNLRAKIRAHYAARLYDFAVAASTMSAQLDVWAKYPAARDDIEARLEPLLHANTVDPTEMPASALLLALGDGWSGTVEFSFTSAGIPLTPDAVQRSEYRLTFRGQAAFLLTFRAQTARLAVIGMQARLAGALPVPDGTPTTTGSVTATTTTIRP